MIAVIGGSGLTQLANLEITRRQIVRTPYGELGYSLRRAGGRLVLHVEAGLAIPPGGIVLRWPYAGKPGAALLEGREGDPALMAAVSAKVAHMRRNSSGASRSTAVPVGMLPSSTRTRPVRRLMSGW